MLNLINKIYLLLAITLYLMLSPKISGEYSMFNYINILSVFTYFIVIHYSFSYKIINKTSLLVVVLIYTILFVGLYNIASYLYTENYFIFSTGDAITYDYFGRKLSSMDFFEGIDYFLDYYYFDDIGMVVIVSTFYKIADSNLIINFFYIFIGMFTTFGIFNISKSFMSKRYAFMASISYSLSSFVLFFHSTGLKASFMIMLGVLAFSQYYQYLSKRKLMNLVIMSIYLLLLIFFRPAVMVLIIASIGIGFLTVNKKSFFSKIIFIFIFFLMIVFSNSIFTIIDKYMAGGFDSLIISKESEGMIRGGLPFTYMVNFLAQFIGPLPTLVSDKTLLTIYAPGLIYRVLLAIPFWIGSYYIFKRKNYLLYPLAIYVVFEMFALAFLLEGLELRKSMSHIPFVFIIAFWFLEQYDRKKIIIKKPQRFKLFFKILVSLLFLVIFYWNFR